MNAYFVYFITYYILTALDHKFSTKEYNICDNKVFHMGACQAHAIETVSRLWCFHCRLFSRESIYSASLGELCCWHSRQQTFLVAAKPNTRSRWLWANVMSESAVLAEYYSVLLKTTKYCSTLLTATTQYYLHPWCKQTNGPGASTGLSLVLMLGI